MSEIHLCLLFYDLLLRLRSLTAVPGTILSNAEIIEKPIEEESEMVDADTTIINSNTTSVDLQKKTESPVFVMMDAAIPLHVFERGRFQTPLDQISCL